MGQRVFVFKLAIFMVFFANSDLWAKETSWSYEGHTGPSYWGQLSEDYKMCQYGVNQSPIEILDTTLDRLFSLGFIYKDVPLQIARRNNTIEVDYGSPLNDSAHEIEISGEKLTLPALNIHDSTLNISGETYRLKKIQFHAPSEHSYELKTYPMEVQLHHEDEHQQIAILSIFFTLGEDNSLIAKLWENLPIDTRFVSNPNVTINAKALLPKQHGYYHYRGSLTTPPCTEGVRWFVFKEAKTLSQAQLDQFKKHIKPNNRPRQAKNYRFLLESL